MADTLKFLILEDLPTDAELLIDELKLAGLDFKYLVVDDEPAFRSALNDFLPDLVFSDFSLPTFTGLDALAIVNKQTPGLPVIIVTGSINEETAVECMKAGAVDYVLKEKLKRLGAAAKTALENARLVREREAMVSQIHEMETSLRLSFNNAAIGMVQLTPDGTFITCNQAFEQLTGYTEAELLGKNFQDITHPDDYPIGSDSVNKFLNGKKVSGVVEKRYIHKKGHTVWVRLSTSLIRDEDGKPLHFFTQAEDITQQKADREELQQAQAQAQRIQDIFKQAIENATGVPYLLNLQNGNYEFVGSEAENLLGVSPDELNRERMRGVVQETVLTDPDYRHQLHDIEYGKKFRSGEIGRYKANFRVQLPDGSEKWISDSAIPVTDVNGKVTHSLGILMDITVRKQAEINLAERERYFRALLNQLHEDLLVIDENYVIRDMNASFLKTVGKTKEEVVGKYCYQISHGYNKPCNEYNKTCVLKQVLQSGEPANCVHEHLLPDGRKTWVDILLSPIRDKDGRITRIIESVRNISDLMEAHNELRTLTAAIEQSPVSVMMTDLEGNIEYVNPKFCELSGYPMEEVLGKNPRFLNSGEQSAEFYHDLWNTITQGKVWRGRFHNRARGGELFWEDATIGPVTDANGKITHFLGIKEDITAQVELEEQLQQSQKLEAVGQLAGGVAHDFNNLLTIINGYSDLLLTKLDAESKLIGDIKQIAQAGERASRLTQQLLAFSRKQVIKPKVLDLNHLIKETDKMLRRLIGEDIILQLELDDQLPAIKADPGQLDQVLLNLSVNARDAMPSGGTLSIATAKQFISGEESPPQEFHPEPGHYVSLRITDSGIGMDAQTRKRIFEPFFTTKGKGKGTGLGLATVYGIIKQSGGYIWVDSEPGVGTTFTICLPAVLLEEESPENPQYEQVLFGGTETVLVVEDEPGVRRLSRDVLQSNGYNVLLAADGNQALEVMTAEQSVDLVVTDVIMPGMSGKELSDELLRKSPDLKIVYVSGYTDDAISRAGILDKGVQFLQKPYSGNTLLKTVRQALDGVLE